MALTYEPISTTTLSTATATVTFSSIPATYTDLVASFTCFSSAGADVFVRFNSESGNVYSYAVMAGDGSGNAENLRSVNSIATTDWYGTPDSTKLCTKLFNINQYRNTNFKHSYYNLSHSSSGIDFVLGQGKQTTAVSSITFYFSGAQTFSSGSIFTLYGILAA